MLTFGAKDLHFSTRIFFFCRKSPTDNLSKVDSVPAATGPKATVVVEQGDQKGSTMTATSSQTVETDKEPREGKKERTCNHRL